MPTALAAPSSSRAARVGDELSLAELLDLFDREEPRTPASWERPSLRTLRKTWARRTAAWNIAPGGAWRAW